MDSFISDYSQKNTALIEYMGMIVDVENNLFTYQEIIKGLRVKASQLGKRNTIGAPPNKPIEPSMLEKPSEPEKPKEGISIKDVLRIIMLGLFVYCIVMGIKESESIMFFAAFLVLLLSYPLNETTKEEQQRRIHTLALNNYDRALGNYHKQMEMYQKRIKDYPDAYESYKEKQKEYEEKERQEDLRVKKELLKKKFLEGRIHELEERKNESINLLKDVYDVDILYPKYRNIVMVNSIYEYLSSGRCSSLEGPYGAYNILETEMRLDRIISRIDIVISKLDQISQNQNQLYRAITQANNIIKRILEETEGLADKISDINEKFDLNQATKVKQEDETVRERDVQQIINNSRLFAYNSERIKKELEYMNKMKFYNKEYSGTVFNLPPSLY